jgi:hypothetical protein
MHNFRLTDFCVTCTQLTLDFKGLNNANQISDSLAVYSDMQSLTLIFMI